MKLWFFRTMKGIYGVSEFQIGRVSMAAIDGESPHKPPHNLLLLGATDYRVDPKVTPGECIPVELVPAETTKKKAKRT